MSEPTQRQASDHDDLVEPEGVNAASEESTDEHRDAGPPRWPA